MKKIIFAFASFLIGFSSFATDVVPKQLQQSFAAQFPKATHIVWSEPETGLFEADFTVQQQHYTALLTEKGTLVHSGQAQAWFDLPTKARHLFINEYEGFHMNYMLKENQASNAQYITGFTQHGDHYVAIFDANGKVIQLTKE